MPTLTVKGLRDMLDTMKSGRCGGAAGGAGRAPGVPWRSNWNERGRVLAAAGGGVALLGALRQDRSEQRRSVAGVASHVTGNRQIPSGEDTSGLRAEDRVERLARADFDAARERLDRDGSIRDGGV